MSDHGAGPSSAVVQTPPTPVRRRDKPQLSCNTCRKRKIRCDRLLPCSNCSTRGIASSCAYAVSRKQSPVPASLNSSTSVQGRINHLETLLLSLMQRQQQPESTAPASTPAVLLSTAPGGGSEQSPALPAFVGCLTPASKPDDDHQVSPSPSDYGAMRVQGSAASYVGNAHWEAVLDSIVELKDHLNDRSQTHASTPDDTQWEQHHPNTARPQLLYASPRHANIAAILEELPPRSTVDRLVYRYFNDLDMATGVLHRGKFFREYDEFWASENNASVNTIWLGLLFAIMCLSTQFQRLLVAPTALGHAALPPDPESQMLVDKFREKTVQCLILGGYAKGGPYVLETLILYFLVEVFPLKEIDIGIWILVGNIVQIATYMGYHRDAIHFPNISPFEGEMRRRLWTMIVQIDFSISTQLGQSRLINETQSNTAEPRNLLDSDFDQDTVDLPPSRPETEVTPILYTLAKLRILSVGAKVNDLTTDPQRHPYGKVLELDRQIDEAHNSLPPYMKWENLTSSLTCPPIVIMQRVWLEICIQRLKMVLYKKFLLLPSSGPHEKQQQLASQSICVTSAARILEFQHLIDEETSVDGRLFQIRWRVSTALTHEFLLATSVLCFYLQPDGGERAPVLCPSPQPRRNSPTDRNTELAERVTGLLRTSQAIWHRLASDSAGARKAYAAICYVLGGSETAANSTNVAKMMSVSADNSSAAQFPGFLDLMPGYNLAMLGPDQMDDGQFWIPQMPSWNTFTGEETEMEQQYHMDFTT